MTTGLRGQFLAGAAWFGIGRGFAFIVGLGVTAVLARLLAPHDFGLIALASVFIGIAQQARDLGVGQALVQVEHVSPQVQRLAFSIALVTSLALGAVLVAAAGPIARFSGNPDVAAIVRVLALTFPVSAFSVVPQAMLRRHLTVRGEAIATAAALLAQSALAIVLASLGWGVWALVAGNLIGTVATAIGLALASPWRPGLQFRGAERAGLVRFGGGVTFSSLLWYAYTNADVLVVGRMLGTSELGLYSMASKISRGPRDKLWALLNPLTLPLFSRSRSDPRQLGEALCKVTTALAIVSLPAVAGLAAVAHDAVEVVLGPKWLATVPVLQLLCVFGIVRALAVLWAPALFAAGFTATVVRFNLVCVVLLPAGFIFGAARYGIVGVASAWAVLYSVLALIWLLPLTLLATKLSLSRYLGAVAHPLLATAVMVASVLATRAVLPAQGAVRLAVTVGVGTAVYAGVLRALSGPIMGRLRTLLQEIRDGFGTETDRLRQARSPEP